MTPLAPECHTTWPLSLRAPNKRRFASSAPITPPLLAAARPPASGSPPAVPSAPSPPRSTPPPSRGTRRVRASAPRAATTRRASP
eukprot:900949-Prymnesium_polylepis.1